MVTASPINNYICDTVARVFENVYYADCEGNREVFAFSDAACLERLEESAATDKADFSMIMSDVQNGLCKYEAGNRILTDDKAPVELLGMKVIDEIISEEIEQYKDLIKGKSLSEIIEILQ